MPNKPSTESVLRRHADLNPPLGVPGGSCYLQDRITRNVQSPRNQQILLDRHLRQKDKGGRGTVYEQAIYGGDHSEGRVRGTSIKRLEIDPHAQYRMDQKGVSMSQIYALLKDFHAAFTEERRDGYGPLLRGLQQPNEFRYEYKGIRAYLRPLRLYDPVRWSEEKRKGNKPGLELHLRTVHPTSTRDYTPTPPDLCPEASKVASRYALKMAPVPGVKTLVTDKSQKGLPTDTDREKQVNLPLPGSATPGGSGRAIPQFSYNTPDSGSDLKPRTLGIPGEQYGHPSNNTYNTVTRRVIESSSGPVSDLKAYLMARHRLYEAEDYDALLGSMENPKEVRRLAGLIGDVDEYLTDKRRPLDSRYDGDALTLLEEGRAVIHLSDGGYSRLTLAFDIPHVLWIDRGLSSAKVVERWERTRAASSKRTRIASSRWPGGRYPDVKSYTDHFEVGDEGYPEWFFVSQGSLSAAPDYGTSDAALPRGNVASSEDSEEGVEKVAYKRRWQTGQRQRRSRGSDRIKRKQYNRRNKQKRKTQSRRWRQRNKNKPAFRQSERRRRTQNRTRKRASVLTVPDIAFLIGPEQMLGYIHSISPMSGMVTIELDETNVSQLDSLPVELFLRMAVFLTEQDIDAFYDLVDVEIGPSAYADLNKRQVRQCAFRYDRDPDSDEFKSDCFGLTDEYELSSMGADQLDSVVTHLVQGFIEEGHARSQTDADNPEISDEYDSHLYYGEVDVKR